MILVGEISKKKIHDHMLGENSRYDLENRNQSK